MDDVKKIILYIFTKCLNNLQWKHQQDIQATSEKVEGCGCSVEKNTGLVRPPCACRHNNTPDMHAYLS